MAKQYALVTGSSSGLGFEMAQHLLEEGHIVFGASRSKTDIDSENFIDIEVDVTIEDSVIQMYDVISRECYGLHVVVNNAGIFEMSPLIETESESFLEMFQTNCLGAFHILKHGHPYVIENRTHYIHISSIAGKRGFPNVSAYCASKFALDGMIEAVREEWKSLGVRFTTLHPGAVDTSLWRNISDDFERSNMLDPEDFIHIFDMVIKSPNNTQFPDITFLHRSGIVE